MSFSKELNLLGKDTGCREHPVLDLTKAFNSLKPGVKLKVVLDKNEIPLDIVQALAKIRNIKIATIEEHKNIATIIAEKQL